MRGLIAHHNTQLAAAGIDEDRKKEAIRDYQSTILSLGAAAQITSPIKWLAEAAQAYQITQTGVGQATDAKEFLQEIVDRKKLGAVQAMLGEESAEVDDYWEATLDSAFSYTLQEAGIAMPKISKGLYFCPSEKGLRNAEKFSTPELVLESFNEKCSLQKVLHAVRQELKPEMLHVLGTELDLQKQGYVTTDVTFKGAFALMSHYKLITVEKK